MFHSLLRVAAISPMGLRFGLYRVAPDEATRQLIQLATVTLVGQGLETLSGANGSVASRG
jgi:hypothetical protein